MRRHSALLFGILLLFLILPVQAQDEVTLATLASQQSRFIGNVISDSYYYEDHRDLAAAQFNFGVLEVYWNDVNPSPGVYDFAWPDEQLAWAEANGAEVLGLGLVWGWEGQLPQWLLNGNFMPDAMRNLMVEHIRAVMTHYAGRVETWIVVNEAYSVDDNAAGGGRDYFEPILGREYVDLAFATARAVDPTATLLYADNNNESAAGFNTQRTLDIVQRLQAQNLIDGLALQMHLLGDAAPNRQDMIDTMRAYDLPIYITELDVDMRNVEGTTAERYQRQALIYGDVLLAALDVGVTHISLWGLSDRYSWLEVEADAMAVSEVADPTLFDNMLVPKPAYYTWLGILLAQASPVQNE